MLGTKNDIGELSYVFDKKCWQQLSRYEHFIPREGACGLVCLVCVVM